MKLHHSLLATSLLIATASPALAETTGYYAGVNALLGFSESSDPERTPAGLPGPVTVSTDNGGVNGGLGVWGGYNWEETGFALELSSTARVRHDQNVRFFDTGVLNGAKSNVTTVDLMVSGIYDIPTGTNYTPYLSAGAGAVWVHQENELLNGAPPIDAGGSDDLNLAWQLGGGMKYALYSDVNLRLDYRYIDMGTIGTSVLPTSTNDSFETDLTSHDVRIGVTWDF